MPAENAPPLVLVVDDNPSNLALIEAQLVRGGYRVTTATSGRAALEIASNGAAPSLVFLDVMMPGLDGYEVCRRLKEDPHTRAIPVVMLTSLRERADKVRALEAGADDFLSKPVDSAELIARVRSLLRLRHLDDDLARSRDEIAQQAEQLAAEKGRAEAILFSIADGVFTTDLDGRISMLNPAAEAVAGVTNEDVVGTPWRDAFRVRDAAGQALTDATCPIAAVARTGQPVGARDLTLWRGDGRAINVDVLASPVRRAGGAPVGIVGVLRDVTRQREVERMKREFVALVSHELRSPAAVIFGFAELMMTNERLSPRGQHWCETIYRETQRLTDLVSDFLDVEKLDAGKVPYHFRALALDQVLADLRTDLAPQMGDRRLVLELPTDPVIVRADPERLTQVLRNLVVNAVKYSPGGGDVRVRVSAVDETATVSVIDQGLGLPPEAIGRLFQNFYRVDRPQHLEIGGTGLGLAICRRLVEGMGGRIWAESAGLGQGSTFAFTLPTASERPLALAPRPGPVMGRILVVKDDPSLAEIIGEQLRGAGYEVEAVTTGAEALERTRASRPAAIVLDLRLPGAMDGWALLGALREDPRFVELPIVVMTGRQDEAYGMALGVDDYLVKPVPASRLVRSVRRLAGAPHGDCVVVAGDEAALPRLVGEALRDAGLTRA